MTIWLILLVGGLLTYAIRLSFIVLLGRFTLSEQARRALRFVPPAVLSAIIFPEMMIRDGALDLSPGNYRLLAGLAAALVAWKTRNILLTILAGMLALWSLQALLGG